MIVKALISYRINKTAYVLCSIDPQNGWKFIRRSYLQFYFSQLTLVFRSKLQKYISEILQSGQRVATKYLQIESRLFQIKSNQRPSIYY